MSADVEIQPEADPGLEAQGFMNNDLKRLVVCQIQTERNGTRGWVEIRIGDPKNPSRVARAAIHYYPHGEAYIQYASVSEIVSRGEEVSVWHNSTSGPLDAIKASWRWSYIDVPK